MAHLTDSSVFTWLRLALGALQSDSGVLDYHYHIFLPFRDLVRLDHNVMCFRKQIPLVIVTIDSCMTPYILGMSPSVNRAVRATIVCVCICFRKKLLG